MNYNYLITETDSLKTTVINNQKTIRVSINNVMVQIEQSDEGIDIKVVDDYSWDHELGELSIDYNDVPEEEEEEYNDEEYNDDYEMDEEDFDEDDQIIK